MITLITGTPGTGKTAYCVNELLELLKLDQARPLFVHGIPELKLTHEQIYCRSRLCDICTKEKHPDDAIYVEDWHTWAPDAAILVLDEVQRIWRPRASSAAVPDSVAELEYHRHRGLDFFMMTQGPHLTDSNVRRLVGRHVHLVAKWAGRFQYEWPECQSDTSTKGDAVKRPYKLPKRVFDLYHSSTVHTKQDKAKPLAVYVLAVAIFAVMGLSYLAYSRIHAQMTTTPENTTASTKFAPPADAPVTQPVTAPIKSIQNLEHFNPTPDFSPRSPGRIESAPAYDGGYTVKPAPVLVAGVIKPDGSCTLIARGGHRYPTTPEYCRAYVKGDVDYPYRAIRSEPQHRPQPMRVNRDDG